MHALELKGLRTAVLGSTSGIGRAVALELADAGADVIVHGRSSRAAAEDVADRVRRQGGRSEVMMADLADREAGDRMVQHAWSLWDGLDAWLHIAGADTLTGESARLPFDAKLDLLWQVNVAATVRLCRSVGRLMKDRGGRHRDHGMGPGRVGDGRRLGRALRCDQGCRHGIHQEPGTEPRARGTRQCAGTGMDQDRLGGECIVRAGRSGCSARPRYIAGGRRKTWPASPVSWSVPRLGS